MVCYTCKFGGKCIEFKSHMIAFRLPASKPAEATNGVSEMWRNIHGSSAAVTHSMAELRHTHDVVEGSKGTRDYPRCAQVLSDAASETTDIRCSCRNLVNCRQAQHFRSMASISEVTGLQ
jgi:hypothetical protein